MNYKELEKKANKFWDTLTQEKFEEIWDELNFNKYYDELPINYFNNLPLFYNINSVMPGDNIIFDSLDYDNNTNTILSNENNNYKLNIEPFTYNSNDELLPRAA